MGFGTVKAGAAAIAAPTAAPSHSASAAAGASQPPASPSRYRPPHARRSSQAEPAAGLSASSSSLHYDSSDSESSDAEGGGERLHASRVRSGALACLQLLAKGDSKSLHGSWTVLLPTSDAVSACFLSWPVWLSGVHVLCTV